VVVLTTTAQLLITADNISFVIEADPGNTVNAKISSTDPTVSISFVSLVPNQQQVFEEWTGPVYGASASSTCSVYVELMPKSGSGKSRKVP
jgi:hypothetical protein